MRVLQINNVHYRRGGADIVYLNTGKLLEEYGHQVYYFSQKNEKNYPANTSEYYTEPINYFDGSIYQRIKSVPRFFYSKESAMKLGKLIKKYKPEIAHIHLYKAGLTPAILKVLKSNMIPVVITLHDFWLICPHYLLLDGKMNICERCLNGSALNCIVHKCNRNNIMLSTLSSFEYIFQNFFFPASKYFDTIIAVSKFAQEKLKQSKKFNLEFQHLYNFIPGLDKLSANPVKGKYMLYIGRLSEEKGIRTLINAWEMYRRDEVLKVVGEGELLDELKKKNLNKVEILGFKSGSELNYLIKMSSFIIVPSIVYETGPLTVAEAYAFGKPVIGSRIGGIPEILKDKKTGFLFEKGNVNDLNEKIELAIKMTPVEYAVMSLNARRFVEENFKESLHYEALMSIYEKTIIKYK